MGRRRRRPDTPPFLRFIVAAVDSRDPTIAQYVCNGVADDVEIAQAFAALGAVEGEVLLLEGTFTLAASIAFTANNQTLRGSGRATYIDGTALGAGVHAIVISGFTDCTIRDFAVETNAGGGLATNCIFIEDGANNFLVLEVTIINSDNDGIRIEGTTITQGHIHRCIVEAADGVGIHVDMDAVNFAYRFHIEDNDIINVGGMGISFAASGGNNYCQIVNNIIYNPGSTGISLTDGDDSLVRGNLVYSALGDGITITTSDHIQVMGNLTWDNFSNGIKLISCPDSTVVGNTSRGNGAAGINLTGVSPGTTATGNTCYDNDWGITVDGGATNVTVTGNTSYSNALDGLTLNSAHESTVSGNVCSKNGNHGIHVIISTDITITGNTCIQNDLANAGSFDGIFLTGSSGCLIGMNTCKDNDRWGIMIDADSDFNKVTNNYTEGNTSGSIRVNNANCDGNEIVFNTVEEGAPSDVGTLTRASGNFDPSADAYIAPIGAAPF